MPYSIPPVAFYEQLGEGCRGQNTSQVSHLGKSGGRQVKKQPWNPSPCPRFSWLGRDCSSSGVRGFSLSTSENPDPMPCTHVDPSQQNSPARFFISLYGLAKSKQGECSSGFEFLTCDTVDHSFSPADMPLSRCEIKDAALCKRWFFCSWWKLIVVLVQIPWMLEHFSY